MGRWEKGDEQTPYVSFARNAKVKEIIEKYNRGEIGKLSEVHSMVQKAMGKKFGRSKFYKMWKQWRLDNDMRRRKKKHNAAKQEEGAEDVYMDYDEHAEVEEMDELIEIAPADRKRPSKWLKID